MKQTKISHNDIALSLTDEKLIRLLSPIYGKKGCYDQEFDIDGINCFFIDKEVKDWSVDEKEYVRQQLSSWGTKEVDFDEAKLLQTQAIKNIRNLKLKDSLFIDKTFEFPLIKGNNQFMCTKGFIDLIVRCSPNKCGLFSTFPIPVKEFVIEIKKEEDFKDFGNILRQIKEYREYYLNGCARWGSNFNLNYKNKSVLEPFSIFFCVLSTRIPDMVKEVFEGENIYCLETEKPKLGIHFASKKEMEEINKQQEEQVDALQTSPYL